MALPRAIASTLTLGFLAACQPAGDAEYSDRYRPRQLERVAAGDLLDATPEEIAAARAEDRAIYQAELQRQEMLAGSLSAQQSARRGAQLLRSEQRLERAQRDRVWAERDLARARRDLRTSERLDRSPVFTGPSDRADARRRQDAFEARRAAERVRRADRAVAGAADRIGRQSAVDTGFERMRPIDRIDRRQAERQRMADAGPTDALVPYLPYRRQGESVETLRARVAEARGRAAKTGFPVESILRDQRD